jgi:predicted dehydrogenase
MRVAIVGCGYVADSYMKTFANHPELEVLGVMDRDHGRASRLGSHYGLSVYSSLDDLLSDKRVEMVLNLTNPRSHFEVSRACLQAGKHVYSEKPLAMELAQAEELVVLAEGLGLYVTSAPCSILGETAQTIWKALRKNAIGEVRLVYAELDDGLIHRMRYRRWFSDSGCPWPYKDEFETGCTLEHAGYYVTWLIAFFGPAVRVTSFASCRIPDKQTDVPLEAIAPDFSVACIEFASGVVARLTCSIVAPHDHSLRIIGDEGVLITHECWDYGSPVYLKRRNKLALWAEKHRLLSLLPGIAARRCPLVRRPSCGKRSRKAYPMDFARGVAEMAGAIVEKRPCRMPPRYALHANEIVLAIQESSRMGSSQPLKTSCEPMEPMS